MDSAAAEAKGLCGRHVLVGSTAQWTKPCYRVGTYRVVRVSAYADYASPGVVCRYHVAPIMGGRGYAGYDFQRGSVELEDLKTGATLTWDDVVARRSKRERKEKHA